MPNPAESGMSSPEVSEPDSLSLKHRWVVRAGWAVFVVVAGLRLIYCLQLPINTIDILRHGIYALEVFDKGFAAADLPLKQINPAYRDVAWSWYPFNYPVMILLFDLAVMGIWPTFFAFKLALTLVDLLTAGLIWKWTRSGGWALSYWALPSAIWWTSHEGQLDGLQNLPIIAALYLLKTRPGWAWACLALAVQCKLFAIFLVPYCVIESRLLKSRRHLVASLIGAWVGSLPTVVAVMLYSPIRNLLFSKGLTYNPYFWDVTQQQMFLWNPQWLVVSNQMLSYGLVVLLAVWMLRRWDPALLAPFLFLVALKLSTQGQFWYLLVLPALIMPIEHRSRVLLFAALPLLDLRSLVQIVFGPFGYQVGDHFGSLTALTPLFIAPPI